MSEQQSPFDRVEELLADRSLFGLTDIENEELSRLMTDLNVDDQSFDRIAALASVAMSKKSESSMPGNLRTKIMESFDGGRGNPAKIVSNPGVSVRLSDEERIAEKLAGLPAKHRRMNRREMVAWTIATASMVSLVIDRRGSWTFFRRPLLPAQSRELLLRNEPDVIQAVCQITEDASARGVSGDFVWSTKAQQGFLSVKGLAVNEPFVHQYQLWIYDKKQDERYPIDGGTFNIESKGVAVIPINPRLPVVQPTLFAVTIEKRGGVVVSNKTRLLFVGQPAATPV